MQEIFRSRQDDNINVQLLRMKSTIKQEIINLKKNRFYSFICSDPRPGVCNPALRRFRPVPEPPSPCYVTAQHRRFSWIYLLSVHRSEFT